MLSISTQQTKPSTSCEGVTFTIRKLSRIQRSLRDLPIFEHRLKSDELVAQWWELRKQKDALCGADPEIAAASQEMAPFSAARAEWQDLAARIETLPESDPQLASIEEKLAMLREPAGKYRELERQREKLCAERPEISALTSKLASVDYEYGLILAAYLVPASIRAGLVSISGVQIDGKPATPEAIATCATPELDDLVREIYAECEVASGLTGTQRKNSRSPIISPEPKTGETTGSTAASAS